MNIKEICDIDVILPLHDKIFGKPFPLSSYYKKCNTHKLYIFAYEESSVLFGYSIIVDESDTKNMYAWYGGVLPEFQGNGINEKFLEHLIEYARQKNYLSVTLASSNIRPHMLRLAIKLGFDIVDIKKRDYGEGNKIYFKYNILPPCNQEISLVENGKVLKLVKIEEKLVKAYKNNCILVKFTNVENAALIYAIKYCNSFSRKMNLIVSYEGAIIDSKLMHIINMYKGIITII